MEVLPEEPVVSTAGDTLAADSERSFEKPAPIPASPERARLTIRIPARGPKATPPSPITEYAASRPRRAVTLKRGYQEDQNDGTPDQKRVRRDKENIPPHLDLDGRLSEAMIGRLLFKFRAATCSGTSKKKRCCHRLAGNAPAKLRDHLRSHYGSLTKPTRLVKCCMKGCKVEISSNELARHIRAKHLGHRYKCLLSLYAPHVGCSWTSDRSDTIREHFKDAHRDYLHILEAALRNKLPEDMKDDE
ncbi:hypothetical protein C8Q76DRAFT_64389 [Earliella scabrosa]|nr:hypothetical protein C8Q76DRAFT_64389 [Earliella scabrosa]